MKLTLYILMALVSWGMLYLTSAPRSTGTQSVQGGAPGEMSAKSGDAGQEMDRDKGFQLHSISFLNKLRGSVAIVIIVALIVILSAYGAKQWIFLKIFSLALSAFSKYLLVFFSVFSVLIAYALGVNFWNSVTLILFWLPLILFSLSALGLRLYDPNFPLWKTLYTAMLYPLISSVLIVVRSFITTL